MGIEPTLSADSQPLIKTVTGRRIQQTMVLSCVRCGGEPVTLDGNLEFQQNTKVLPFDHEPYVGDVVSAADGDGPELIAIWLPSLVHGRMSKRRIGTARNLSSSPGGNDQ